MHTECQTYELCTAAPFMWGLLRLAPKYVVEPNFKKPLTSKLDRALRCRPCIRSKISLRTRQVFSPFTKFIATQHKAWVSIL